ncbi:MAG: cell wall-binding repeat-containing protein [Chloroflexota bacterium]|nr:MAG: cell wall-binding repeat-containing protein [Chloroflexota bacterium]
MIETGVRLARSPRLFGLLLTVWLGLSAFPLVAPVAADGADLVRYAGPDRYATAAAISAASFPPGVSSAYVATGTNFPDALAGAAAAAAENAPTLLVTPSTIPDATAAELRRLQPGRIVILGGPTVVGENVAGALRAYTGGPVVRIAGADRYATAAAISATTFAPGVAKAYVATGATFPDALGGAAAAGRNGAPVLLVARDWVPPAVAAELQRLAPAEIVILGGTGAVSAAVQDTLQGYTAGSVVRIAGTDRYDTSLAISRATYESATTVYLATGANFPDALAGAPLRGPLLLTPGEYLPPAVRAEIVRLGAERIIVLGAAGAIRDSTAHDAAGLPYEPADGRWIGNAFDGRAVRFQQPDPAACTATAAMLMLNMAAYAAAAYGAASAPEGFAWTPTVSYEVQAAILAWEREHMTQPVAGTAGSDPHGWRNALNHFGWGSMESGVYQDLAFGSLDAAIRQAIVSAATTGKPTGLLMGNGTHAVVLHGWDVNGGDPRAGSFDFAVNGVYLTDPWQPNGHRNYYVPMAGLVGGSQSVRFGPYLELDSTAVDPIDGRIGRDEWYGQYVIVAAVR